MVKFFHDAFPLGALPRPQPPQMVRGLLWCWGGVQAGRLATGPRSARVRTAPRHGAQRPHAARSEAAPALPPATGRSVRILSPFVAPRPACPVVLGWLGGACAVLLRGLGARQPCFTWNIVVYATIGLRGFGQVAYAMVVAATFNCFPAPAGSAPSAFPHD